MVKSRKFSALPEVLKDVRRFLSNVASSASFAKQVPDLILAATEAAGNAIRHSGSDTFTVAWNDEDGTAEVQVTDQGVFKRRTAVPALAPVGRGHGIPLMIAVTDEFELTQGSSEHPGTTVRFTKRKLA